MKDVQLSRGHAMTTISGVMAYAKRSFSNACGSHDWEHTQRVCNLCIVIGKAEGADLEILQIAAYLHDVGRPYQDESKGDVCHAEKGAEMARGLMEEYPISGDRKENIIHCILSHRFRGDRRPKTPEARILFDADKLDAIGAVGIARAFLFAGEVGAKLHNPAINPEDTLPYTEDDTGYREFKLKLSKIKGRMLTAEGSRIAHERHDFMAGFFERFLAEYEGTR